MHGLSLDAVRNLGAAVGDGPAIPGYDEVAAEDLMHAGWLGMAMVAPDPTLPYARWSNAMTVLDTHVSFAAYAEPSEGGTPDPEAEVAAQSYLEGVGSDGLLGDAITARYDQLGCTPEDEAAAVAAHLGLPSAGAARDLAALAAMSDLIDRADPDETAVLVTTLSIGERLEFSILQRLLHGPALAGDDEAIRGVLDAVRSAADRAAGAGEQGEAIDLPELPTALAEATRVVPTTNGVCISLRLRGRLASTSLDSPQDTVMVDQPPMLPDSDAPGPLGRRRPARRVQLTAADRVLQSQTRRAAVSASQPPERCVVGPARRPTTRWAPRCPGCWPGHVRVEA